MFGVQQHLSIAVCKDADEAVAKGFVYRRPEVSAMEIEQVVVVRKGTQEGNSTVDLVCKDEQGNKYVVMLTGKLLKSIPYFGN